MNHRPYPSPQAPFVMRQSWHDLLFMHWPVPVEALRPKIPGGLAIDTFDGNAWLAVVPFRMSGVYPRRLFAVPRLSAFPELNVRTYVTRDDKPGVWFFSLDAANALAVQIARSWFALPYYHADMRCEESGKGIGYRSARIHRGAPQARFAAEYAPVGPAYESGPDSIEWFLTARYCLYTERRGVLLRGEIDHPAWPLQPAECAVASNSMAQCHGIELPDTQPLLHFARRLDVVVWPLRPC